ncbi:MAG: TRAP transporter small permease [Candidatus Rokuibacteriota bacterium]
MSGLAGGVERLTRGLSRAVEAALVVLTATFSGLAFVQVVLRYGLNHALFWADELSLFAFTWTIFLSAALALDRRGHFGVSILVARLPPGMRQAIAVAVHLVMLAVVGFLLWFGTLHAWDNWVQVSDVLRLPLTWWYLALPVACLLMGLSLVRDLALLARGGALPGPADDFV